MRAGPLPHAHQLAPHRGRGRLHRRGLRGPGGDHLGGGGRGGQGPRTVHGRGSPPGWWSTATSTGGTATRPSWRTPPGRGPRRRGRGRASCSTARAPPADPRASRSGPAGPASARAAGSLTALIQGLFGFTDDTTYLNPAPLYHAAPLGWTTAVQRLGGTVVCMEAFDPVRGPRPHRGTTRSPTPSSCPPTSSACSSCPTAVRTGADLSSLQVAVHAAAPCPVEVKQQMLAWWGPIIHEYYAGSEGNGFCAVGPRGLARPPGDGRPTPLRRAPRPRPDGRESRPAGSGADLVRDRDPLRLPQRPGEDPGGARPPRLEHARRRRATSTTTASSTSPTGSRT